MWCVERTGDEMVEKGCSRKGKGRSGNVGLQLTMGTVVDGVAAAAIEKEWSVDHRLGAVLPTPLSWLRHPCRTSFPG